MSLLTYSFNDLHRINLGSSQWHKRIKYIKEHLRKEEEKKKKRIACHKVSSSLLCFGPVMPIEIVYYILGYADTFTWLFVYKLISFFNWPPHVLNIF